MARMVARTTLTDVAEGSVLLALLQTVAEQIAEADIRLAGIRDQFTLEGASGVDLDERAEEIGITRPATGDRRCDAVSHSDNERADDPSRLCNRSDR